MRLIFRPTTPLAAYLRKRAWDMAKGMEGRRVLHRVEDGFLLRAVAMDDVVTVTVIDLPAGLTIPYNAGYYNTYRSIVAWFINDRSDLLSERISTAGIGEPTEPGVVNIQNLKFPAGAWVPFGDLPDISSGRFAGQGRFTEYVGDDALLIPGTLIVGPIEGAQSRLDIQISLTLCRVSASTKTAAYIDTPDMPDGVDIAVVDESENYPLLLEFAPEVLGLDHDERIVTPGPCFEWEKGHGVVSAYVSKLDGSTRPTMPYIVSQRMILAGYKVTERESDEGETRYVGEIIWLREISADTVPDEIKPQVVDLPNVLPPGFIPYSGYSYLAVNGRSGEPVRGDPYFRMGPDRWPGVYEFWTNLYFREPIQAAGVSVDRDALSATMLMAVYSSEETALIPFVARSFNPDTFIDLEARETTPASVKALLSVRIDRDGGLSTRVLERSVYAARDPAHYTQPWEITQPRFATHDASGAGVLVCSKVTAEAAESEPVGGGEKFKVYAEDYLPSDISMHVYSHEGEVCSLSLGGYYPLMYEVIAGHGYPRPAVPGTRYLYGFLPSGPMNNPHRARNVCHYAPGLVAVVLAPVSGYVAEEQVAHVGVFSLETGAMVAVSDGLIDVITPSLLSGSTARFSQIQISCVEEGGVDDAGEIVSHAVLLLVRSRQNGMAITSPDIYVLTELEQLTHIYKWELTSRPTPPPAYYLGTPLAPAKIGRSTGRSFMRRPIND
jgi:hypothetical protein